MKILFIDRHVVICEKQAGELSEGATSVSLPLLLSEQLKEQGQKSSDIFTVHRLDRETSGIMVFARSAASAAALGRDIREGRFCKEYLAITHGCPEETSGTLRDLLFYDRRRGKSFTADRMRKGVKEAVADYSVLCTCDGLSLIKLSPHTGRTHQLRLQLASRRLPIVGDRRYGAPKSEISDIALLSYSLSFPHPTDGHTVKFVCDTPTRYPWSCFDICNILKST